MQFFFTKLEVRAHFVVEICDRTVALREHAETTEKIFEGHAVRTRKIAPVTRSNCSRSASSCLRPDFVSL